ncbi:MAG: hypothetical protein E6Y08_03865 [Paenibacillus sp.]|uniref:hypothetical protein n=1 Tax=Paenibacillus sp. TaxID=58172 RepID=UPI0029158DC2|nr:hypothetical protein [Paenibacillus sp.]MBE6069863.1 hypothetical protein [Clostridium lundense]MDU4694929.1 hypothetical protein [Paenibacillus sp.]
MNKKFNIMIIFILLPLLIISCKPAGNNFYPGSKKVPFQYVNYEIFEKNSKVGELEVSLNDTNAKIIIKEVKLLDGDKLPGIGLNIKNVREYELSKEVILTSYTEKEYLNDILRYEDNKKVVYDDGARIVESTITEYKQQADNIKVNRKLVLAPDSNLQVGSIYYVLYPYLEQQLSGKYHFYTDLEGSSGYVESTGQELLKINEKIEKNTFKLQTNIPMKTELWYDKDTGILLKKIEYYNKNYVLRYEINIDSLRE